VAASASKVSGVAQRYATALFDLADEKQAHDAIAESLGVVLRAVEESADLKAFLANRKIASEAKASAIAAVLDSLGAHPLVRNLAGLMAANNRLEALPGTAQAYLAELAKRRGEITAEVTAAQALSEAQSAALNEQLRAAHGAKVNMSVTVDPSLIGGLIVKVGSKMIDSSMKSKLLKMQLAMKGAA
jgi:F-type H+-transporting ATPase subunit delta